MPDASIAVSRLMVCWHIGWPIHPYGAKQRGYKYGHPFDYESEMKAWPWYRLGLHFVPFNKGQRDTAPGCRLWIYSNKGARAIDLFWRPLRFWARAHLHLPRLTRGVM